ncbi:MAG: tRNA (adenosine(37)-N6)-dimethylallyltransferase MiaA [Candidatus Hydrogenedentes bacterium]|nr:tRNA (adenosine(37)-N6)-dimethylallyltransferase MiaA [Candidatus Hydrogenedentota bacterium]
MIAVLAVVGPTASGKTALAIELAERLDTEIISADSMQVYKGMEIGTAAPTAEERARVKHHFVGFLDPGEFFSAGEYQKAARAVVTRLNADGKIAVAVGGSGLYIRALLDGLFEGPAKDDRVRERLHREAEEHGVGNLYERLGTIDPAYAWSINENDRRRVVRALEVYELTGQPLSKFYEAQRARPSALVANQIALDWPRHELYERINRRADHIFTRGFVAEVKGLVNAGYQKQLDRLRSLGYRETAAYLRGECTLEEAKERMKQNTRRFAKRQLTWFRADKRVHWLPVIADETPAACAARILIWIGTVEKVR